MKEGHLPDREGLIKDATKLHYGKCRTQGFWGAYTGDLRSGYIGPVPAQLQPYILNLSLFIEVQY